VGVRVGVANVFLGQSIGMRLRTIHFSSNFHSTFKTEESTVLGGFWALEWTWHPADTNLRCARSSGICIPIPNSLVLIVSEISAFIRTDRQTDMTRSTRLEILTKNLFSDESSIPFYSTSNGYNNIENHPRNHSFLLVYIGLFMSRNNLKLNDFVLMRVFPMSTMGSDWK